MFGSRHVSTWSYAAAKSSGAGGGLAALAVSGCSRVAVGLISLCTPPDWGPVGVPRGRVKGPGRVMRGYVKGSGRVLRGRVEAPCLGWVDGTGEGGGLFSFCARLGAQLPWA